jgi:hypothetical protein
MWPDPQCFGRSKIAKKDEHSKRRRVSRGQDCKRGELPPVRWFVASLVSRSYLCHQRGVMLMSMAMKKQRRRKEKDYWGQGILKKDFKRRSPKLGGRSLNTLDFLETFTVLSCRFLCRTALFPKLRWTE